MQYLKSIYQRYHKSTRKEKREILNEFCTVCRYNRKYAIRILNALPSDEKSRHTKKRNKIYSDTTISILEAIWPEVSEKRAVFSGRSVLNQHSLYGFPGQNENST